MCSGKTSKYPNEWLTLLFKVLIPAFARLCCTAWEPLNDTPCENPCVQGLLHMNLEQTKEKERLRWYFTAYARSIFFNGKFPSIGKVSPAVWFILSNKPKIYSLHNNKSNTTMTAWLWSLLFSNQRSGARKRREILHGTLSFLDRCLNFMILPFLLFINVLDLLDTKPSSLVTFQYGQARRHSNYGQGEPQYR